MITKPQDSMSDHSGVAKLISDGTEVRIQTSSGSSLGITSISTAATAVNLLATIAQSLDSYGGRLGRKIRVLNVKIRGTLLGGQTNSVGDDPYNVMRVSVVSAIGGQTFSGHSVYSLMDSRSNVYSGLQKVHFDKSSHLCVKAKDSTGYIAVAEPCEITIPINKEYTYYGVGAVTPISSSLYLLVVSDSTAVVHPGFSPAAGIVVEFTSVL